MVLCQRRSDRLRHFSFGSNKDASMHIGCCDSNGGNPFNGAIDDVWLYNQALTAAEVKVLATK